MEGAYKVKFIKNGATTTLTKLPPGFRFQPTDEELLFQYLKRKIFSLPLPAYIIPEVNVWAYDPWNLPGGGQPNQEMKYFFSSAEPKYGNNSSGYWRDYGAVQRFFPSPEDPMIMGIKRSMVYHKVMGFSSTTDWIMDVYSLVPSNNDIASQGLRDLLETWVICSVIRSSSNSNDSNSASNSNNLTLTPMAVEEDGDDETASSSSSSSSTAIVDVVSTSSSARYMYIK